MWIQVRTLPATTQHQQMNGKIWILSSIFIANKLLINNAKALFCLFCTLFKCGFICLHNLCPSLSDFVPSAAKPTHPGIPPDSMRLARDTSSLHTSNCHLRRPMTPHNTLPVWTPMRMSTLVRVASRTLLKRDFSFENKNKRILLRKFLEKTTTLIHIFVFLIRCHAEATLLSAPRCPSAAAFGPWRPSKAASSRQPWPELRPLWPRPLEDGLKGFFGLKGAIKIYMPLPKKLRSSLSSSGSIRDQLWSLQTKVFIANIFCFSIATCQGCHIDESERVREGREKLKMYFEATRKCTYVQLADS